MQTPKRPIPMPHYQIRCGRDLRCEVRMTKAQYSTFCSMIRFTANEHLDCTQRVEKQDPDALQRFMDKVHSRDPSLAKKYEQSWVIMAYLEQYVLSRQRHHSSNGRCPFVRCPDPLWVRYARAQAEGVPVSKSSQVGQRGRGCRKSDRIMRAQAKCRIDEECSDDEPTLVADASSRDTVRDFLRSVRPPLEGFYSLFVEMGMRTGKDLDILCSWPTKEQESILRKQFEQNMNFLQLNGLLVSLRGRAKEVA